jgi:hypothetical protein
MAGLKTKTLRSSSSLGAPDNTPNCLVVFMRFKIKEAAGREEVRKRKDVALRSNRRMICSTDEGGWRADGVRLGQVRELENGAITRPRKEGRRRRGERGRGVGTAIAPHNSEAAGRAEVTEVASVGVSDAREKEGDQRTAPVQYT